VFKTKICEFQTDDQGHCVKYGRHCAKAHGECDKRVPYNHKQNQENNKEQDLNDLTTEVLGMIEEKRNNHIQLRVDEIKKILEKVGNKSDKTKMVGLLAGIVEKLKDVIDKRSAK